MFSDTLAICYTSRQHIAFKDDLETSEHSDKELCARPRTCIVQVWPGFWRHNHSVIYVQSGASGCEKGFVKCFLRVPEAVGSLLLPCSQETFCKALFTT